MFTIDLEQSLIKNKRKVLSKEEIMVLDKMHKLESMSTADSALLKDLGMWKDNLNISSRAKQKLSVNERYPADRVFHKNDIKKLCTHYGLRFLRSKFFNGELDAELPNKIRKFQETYGIKPDYHNSYIAAPAKSFNLQERPKDPLFFVELNNDYYYLLHKWGQDISAARWITNLLNRNALIKPFILAVLGFFAGMYFGSYESPTLVIGHTIMHGILGILITSVLVMCIFVGFAISGNDETGIRILFGNNKSNWDSEYIN